MAKTWNVIIEGNCNAIEADILGFHFRDRSLLIRALLRKAAYKDKDLPAEYTTKGHQIGLDTFGDKALDFAIYDHFSDVFLSCENTGKKKIRGIINGYREWYSKNEILEEFARDCIKLQDYVIWGVDEYNKKIWDQSSTKMLADCFEALVGAAYKDRGLPGVQHLLEHTGFFEKINRLHFQKGDREIDPIDRP